MATLTGKTIKDTYKSLIKVNDNEELAATLQELTDGLGNGSGISINTTGDLKATGTLEFGSLKDTGENITIAKFVDEADGIASNDNDTSIPTTAAIVDYVAAQITLEDLDFTGDTGTGSVDLDSQTLNLVGANGVVTTASGQTITIDTSSLDTRLTTAEANISSNDTDIATNASNISTNAANIASNDTDISGLDTRLTTAESNISSNDTDIATNAANIASNDTDIATNASNIATNATNISSNDTDITALQNDKYDKTGGTISGSVTISDDLTVNGTTTTVNTETLSVEDPLIEMANQNAANTVDTGFYAKYSLDAGTTTKYAGLFKDASDSDTFKLFRGLEVEPTTTINTGGTGYALADLEVAGLEASTITKTGGVSTEFLKADGSVDSNTYLTTESDTLDSVTDRGNTTTNAITVGEATITGDLTVDTNTLYVDSANNRVGIGVTSPNTILDVRDTDALMRVAATNASGEATFELRGVGSNGTSNAISRIKSIPEGAGTAASLSFTTRNSSGTIEEKMRIDSSGRVGIGTTSPATTLEVSQVGTGNTNGQVLAETQGANGNSGYGFRTNGTTRWNISTIGTDGSNNLRFYDVNNNAERMRIDSSGNVGINTNTVSASSYSGSTKILEVAHNNAAVLSLNNTANVRHQIISDAAGSLSFWDDTNNAERLQIDSSGRVGIGESNPTRLLHLSGSGGGAIVNIERTDVASGGGGLGGLQFLNSDGNTMASVTASAESSNTTSYLSFRTTAAASTENPFSGATERMRITSSGRVGIGQDNPSSLLEIASTNPAVTDVLSAPTRFRLTDKDTTQILNQVTGTIEWYTNDATDSGVQSYISTISNNAGAGTMVFGTGSPSGLTERLRITGAGNVGINQTNPLSKLHITNDSGGSGGYLKVTDAVYNGDVRFGMADGVDNDAHFGTWTNNNIVAFTNSTERMRITSSGNVGIGTSNPNYKIQAYNSSNGTTAAFGGTVYGLRIDNGGTHSSTGTTIFGVDDTFYGSYQPLALAASQLSFNTGNNVPRMTIDSSGNVGIGTTSPRADAFTVGLTIGNTTTGAAQLVLEENTLTGGWRILSNGFLGFYANNDERMRIDSSGILTVGAETASNRTSHKIQLSDTSEDVLSIQNATNTVGNKVSLGLYLRNSNNAAREYSKIEGEITANGAGSESGNLLFYTIGSGTLSERMRIDSSGHTFINTTTSISGDSRLTVRSAAFAENAIECSTTYTGSSNKNMIRFYDGNNDDCGEIVINPSSNTTNYSTSSDYRLKEDAQDFDGLSMVNDINVYDFKWKKSDKRSYGVFAHELQEVLPQAVNGGKDGEETQSVDYSKIVPILTKALQEQQQTINDLKARIETLENQ